MNRRVALRLLAPVLALLLATGSLAACTSSHSASGATSAGPSGLNDQTGTGPYQGIGMTPPQPRPSFVLTDTAGQSFDFGKVTAGHPTLLYFGYTTCPDACPETMANIREALTKVPAALQKQTYVVFVTTDVKQDTATAIAKWLGYFAPSTGATWVGLRGTQQDIDTAEAAAKIPLASDDGQTHSTELLLFGPDNYAHVSYALTTDVTQQAEQIAHDLPIVAKS